MDKDYDEKEAVEALNRTRAICLGNKIRPHLSNFVKGEGWEDSTTIRKFEEPSCWRMAQVDANGVFEVVVHVQGVIEDKKLPPGLKFDATKGTSERPMLEMSNRIFTPKVEAPNMNPAKVDKQMDENGVIERTNTMDAMFVYGEENIVLYGEEKTDEEHFLGQCAFHPRNYM